MWLKLKRKIVRKLGGMFMSDLPMPIQVQILKHQADKSIDRNSAWRFDSGF